MPTVQWSFFLFSFYLLKKRKKERCHGKPVVVRCNPHDLKNRCFCSSFEAVIKDWICLYWAFETAIVRLSIKLCRVSESFDVVENLMTASVFGEKSVSRKKCIIFFLVDLLCCMWPPGNSAQFPNTSCAQSTATKMFH